MKYYLILGLVIITSLVLGFIFGRFLKRQHNGVIVIGLSEDGEREQVRFILDLDLDEIKNRKELVLGVENHLSQNSQAI